MSTVIYYFTGTGNSLDIASKLAERLDAELIPVAAATGTELKSFDRTGVVFPTYMYRPPIIVADFLKQLPRSPYLFAVATMGGDAGDVLKQTEKILNEKGQTLNAAFTLTMPDNYIPFGGPPDDERIARMFQVADDKIIEITDIVKKMANEMPPKPSWFKTHIYPALWYKIGYWAIPGYDSNFWLNDNCTGCGLCAKVCPVNNITMKDDRPVWHNSCEQCMACIQWCKPVAIELGKKSAGVKRYRHPAIKLKQIIGQKQR